ncbi:acetolactate decarboxylase [Streptococcus halotolerans]|uniref:acetolactate decarboxylase n=1 Tax=Streptococcus halotolerans TaxID=1814128 RepID=UPI000787DC8F|nr:acetolactate decarboxylase [Streptococcus halotolerans]
MKQITKLFQYGTLGALMTGLYDGTMTIGELLEHGDIGIGTLDQIDGELIVLDGKAYQAKSTDGRLEVLEVSSEMKVPYAAVVPHRASHSFTQNQVISDNDLQAKIETYFEGKNLFKSFKMHGNFQKMHVRMIPTAKTGESFVTVAANQPEHTAENVSGTIVGIWTPDLFHGIGVAGYHLHFLSDDHSFGGHIMDYVMTNGRIEIGDIDQLDQRFPVSDEKYLKSDFNLDQMRSDITAAE